MKALSIRQPWAHLILYFGKDIENRSWNTNFRGRILIHASKGMTQDEWCDAILFKNSIDAKPSGHFEQVNINTIPRGGIVGSVEIVDCVERSNSPWFMGRYGFVLRDPRPLTFFPCKGSLGFFECNLLDGVIHNEFPAH